MPMTISLRIVLAGTVASLAIPAQGQLAVNYHYLYEGEPIPLLVDPSQIAAYSGQDHAPALELNHGAVQDRAVTLGEAIPHAVTGWATVPINGGANRAGGVIIEQVVANLAQANPMTFISPVFENEYGPLLITHDLLIEFHRDIFEEEAAQLIADLDLGQILDHDFHGVPGLYRVRSSSNNGFVVLDQANRATRFPEVRYAEPDMVMTAHLAQVIPNDPLFNDLWGIHNTGQFAGGLPDFDMDGPEAWDITTGDPGILITVMDNGIDLSHLDINSIPGVDFTGTSTDGNHDPANLCDGHGTNVAGTIAAKINNALGVVGIAPTCRVAPTKVFLTNNQAICDNRGTIQPSWVVAAIDWAVTNGARVTNSSLFYGVSGAVDSAFHNSADLGLVHFGSSGNDTFPRVVFPSSSSAVISVGAADWTGAKAAFSNWGPALELMGPGVSIKTTFWGGTYGWTDGTSFASPYAAGVAALVLSRNPILTNADVTQILIDSATNMRGPGWDELTGYGLVNAGAALAITPLPTLPQSFALLSPSLSQINVPLLPTFTWERSVQTHDYLLEVDDQADFSSPAISVMLKDTSFTREIIPLPTATVFWWRVTATNPLGATSSSIQSFTTLSDSPAGFSLAQPADLTIDVSQTPTLSWSAANLADDYLVTVSVHADLSSPAVVAVATGTSLTVGVTLEPLTDYFWSVEAQNPIGSTPSTPALRQFTTVEAAPAAFALISPAGSVFVSTPGPTFQWEDSVGAMTYTITIDNDPNFNSPAFLQSGIAGMTIQIPAGALVDRTLYNWKVDAVNSAGTTLALFAPREFTAFFSTCLGDADFNGTVDFDDINSVLSNWGATFGNGTGQGDALPDGLVDFTDITAVLGNWLNTCP